MSKLHIVIFIVLVFLAGGALFCISSDNEMVSGNQKFKISESDLPILSKEAMAGSPESAFRLSQYYDFIEFDHTKALYWLRIAAENGLTSAQYNYAISLLEENEELTKIRAIYWLKIAATAGDPVAIEKLEQITVTTE